MFTKHLLFVSSFLSDFGERNPQNVLSAWSFHSSRGRQAVVKRKHETRGLSGGSKGCEEKSHRDRKCWGLGVGVHYELVGRGQVRPHEMMLQEEPADGEGSARRRSREVVQAQVSASAKALGLEGA